MCHEFQTQAVIASSPNGWMNTEMILQWAKNVIGAFSFNRRLSAWDSSEYHIGDTAIKSLATKKIDTVIVPGGFKRLMFHGIRHLKPITQKSMMIGWLQKESIMIRKQAI